LTIEAATTLRPCDGLCLEEIRHTDVNPSTVFGPVHQNVAPVSGRSLLSIIDLFCYCQKKSYKNNILCL